ncbi:glycosyl hydrolase family 18 protein [Paenibacillus sp. KS1]|uniref:glycosyl hydrolase family 18 protein n=1 Tax=Paenibacillus sp. KS1 TaxID=1849249 RepID=UPI0009F449F1|nr:glycosyl hydrolase family 18 protein [Paenibacillus sp. KS1]
MRKVKKVSAILFFVFILVFTAVPLTAFAASPWAPNTAYKTGDLVTYGTDTYQCVQGHTSLVGWEPPNVPALWSKQLAPTDTEPPTAPTNVVASNITTVSITLGWTASTDNVGVTGYDVYNGTTLVGSTATTSFTASGLTPNTTYTFTVKAKDAAGNISPASSPINATTLAIVPDTQPPTVPANVTASNVTSNSVTLNWTASTDNVGVTGYDVYNGSILAGSSTTTSYTVTGLNASTAYTFTVTAKDAAGNVSAASSPVNVTTSAVIIDTEPPTAPANLTASTVTTNSVSLSWIASTDNIGVTGYDIYNGTSLTGSSTTTSYTVTGLTANTAYTFTVKAKDAAGNVSAASNALTVTTRSQPSSQYEIIGYFPSWAAYDTPSFTPANVDATKVTVINYAFLDICWNGKHGNPSKSPDNPNPNTWTCQNGNGTPNNAPNGSIVIGDSFTDGTADGGYNQLVTIRQLKNTNPNLKLFASVGGWTWSNQFSNTANDPVTRGNFATSAVNFLRQYQFDGIDIDWEYPNSIGVPCASGQTCQRTADKANYILLLQTLRQALDKAGQQDGKRYYITIASSANSSFLADAGGTNNWLSNAAQYLDWINIMTYDYYGPWDATSGIGSPLYNDPANTNGSSQFNINSTVTNYLNKGIPANKITVGEPFYGYGWKGCNAGPNNNGLYQSCSGEATGGSSGSTYDFAHMQNTGLLSADSTGKYTVAGQGYTRYWNNVTQTPFLYNPSTKVFISYDDEQSIHLKNEFIKTKGLRGAMFWELNADRNRTLQSVVSNDLPH